MWKRTIALAFVCMGAACPRETPSHDWRATGGDGGNTRYSALDQINRDNVSRLKVAWTYHTGEVENAAQIQATPIIVDGVLYATTGAGKAFALRAETGEEIWKFDPYAGRRPESNANRGVVYWESPNHDDRRIFFTAGSRLYALDAVTGTLKKDFGSGGEVDLKLGLDRDTTGLWVVGTSPGVIYKDLLIQGDRVSESDGAAPGHVRAFDVRTGAIRWTFRTIPRPGEFGYDTWPDTAWHTVGGANSWGGMTVDVERGIVFVPTGSATPDFFGGARVGANLFANSLIALDAKTGQRLWHFQTVHHDLLDRDLPTAPNLVTLERDGKRIDAVAQITKNGQVFVFDRTTGAPLFPIEERAVPPSDVPGEVAWPTQPFPVKPAPFARQEITEADLTDRTPQARANVLSRFRMLRNDGQFTPPSVRGSIVFPGFDGGGEWGGSAVDRETGVLYVNASEIPWIGALVPNIARPVRSRAPRAGSSVYASACASCHGNDRRGDGTRAPSLIDVRGRLTDVQIRDVIDRGRGFMPAASTLSSNERDAVISYLLGHDTTIAPRPGDSQPSAPRAPFRLRDYERWVDPDGFPAIKPPWGTLTAIDLNSGEHVWRIPLGDLPQSGAGAGQPTGAEQYGGPIVTAGGLVFIAATKDEKFRAFDKLTGAPLWEASLPAAGYATPATYMVGGRQYVVVAAAGGKVGTKLSDTYVAFAVP